MNQNCLFLDYKVIFLSLSISAYFIVYFIMVLNSNKSFKILLEKFFIKEVINCNEGIEKVKFEKVEYLKYIINVFFLAVYSGLVFLIFCKILNNPIDAVSKIHLLSFFVSTSIYICYKALYFRINPEFNS